MASIYASSRRPDEVILVVDDPDDPTLKCTGDFPVKNIINPAGGIGAARKVGIDGSNGDIVIFVDADSVVHPRMIEAYETVFLRHPAVMVQSGSVIDIRSKDASHDNPVRAFVEGKTVDFAETMRMALRRRVTAPPAEETKSIGNFDESFGDGGEDLDFCLRLRAKGIKIHCNPRAVVYHIPRENIGERIRKSARNGNTLAHVFFKHGLNAMHQAVNAVFHTLSITSSLLFSLAGLPSPAVAVLLPSLLHRFYRFTVDVSPPGFSAGNIVRSSLVKNFLAVYVMHFAFTKELLFMGTAKLLRVS